MFILFSENKLIQLQSKVNTITIIQIYINIKSTLLGFGNAN